MLYKKIRNILMAALIITTGICVLTVTNKDKEIEKTAAIDVEELNAEDTSEDIYKQQEILNETINKSNKVIIAEGDIDIKYLFSNTDDDLMMDDNANCYKSLHEKLFKKEIEYESNYSYNYTYQLNDVEITLVNDKIVIKLYEDKIRLEDIAEDPNKTKFSESYGWLVSDFTPKEIKAMEKRMYSKTYNYLITNSSLKEEALKNLERAFEDICCKLEIKNYMITISENKTITNQDKYTTIENNNINTVNVKLDA